MKHRLHTPACHYCNTCYRNDGCNAEKQERTGDEVLLCEEFVSTIRAATKLSVFGDHFKDLFAFLVEASKQSPLTLAIDEFQEFARINGSIYSDMQDIWDSNKTYRNTRLTTGDCRWQICRVS